MAQLKTANADQFSNPVMASTLDVDRVLQLGESGQLPLSRCVHGTIVVPFGNKCNYCYHMETKSRNHRDFGVWLDRQLSRREWSQADLARRLNVQNATVSRWISGVRQPDTESCERIADVLFLDVDEVLAIAGHRPCDIDIDPDAPGEQIAVMARRISWSEDRYESVRDLFTGWLERDRHKQESPMAK